MRLVTSLKTTIPLAFKIVFSNPVYIGIATAVFTIFWIIFNVFDQLLFFSPVVTFYLPDDAVTAAMAAQCANDQGKFWNFYNILFKNQGEAGLVRTI